MMLRGGYASEYDAHVGRKLANILAGGALSSPQMVSEQYVLDPRARSLCFALRGKENSGTHLRIRSNRQAAP